MTSKLYREHYETLAADTAVLIGANSITQLELDINNELTTV